MKHLYDGKVENWKILKFRINGGGEHQIQDAGEIVIKFLNGKFHSCDLPFAVQSPSRNQLRVLLDVILIVEQYEEIVEKSTTQYQLAEIDRIAKDIREKYEVINKLKKEYKEAQKT